MIRSFIPPKPGQTDTRFGKQIYEKSFIAKMGMSTLITPEFFNGVLMIELTIMESVEGIKPSVQTVNIEGKLNMFCMGFDSPLGTATVDPVPFGETEGRQLFFNVCSQKIGEVVLVHFSLLMEEE